MSNILPRKSGTRLPFCMVFKSLQVLSGILFCSPAKALRWPSWVLIFLVGTVSISSQTLFEITNTAFIDHVTPEGESRRTPTNSVKLNVAVSVPKTPSTLELLQYAPKVASAELVTVEDTGFDSTGNGDFFVSAAPTIFGESIDLDEVVPLRITDTYHMGEPIFLRLTDGDQNINPRVAESIVVSITTDFPLDVEILRLDETGVDTGVFVGFIQSDTIFQRLFDGVLAVEDTTEITARYTDDSDRFDISVATAIVDPFSVVFDSTSGALVNGAEITIIDANTGQIAPVFGDDGISVFPSTVISGRDHVDSGGKVYSFPEGGYRFPFLQPGRYRFEIVAPVGFAAPSIVETSRLQTLPGAPFSIVAGSREEPFDLLSGGVARIDIPLDPESGNLFIRLEASKTRANIGEFIQYTVTVENPDPQRPAIGVSVDDILPFGFRYRSGSGRFVEGQSIILQGSTAADPTRSDGNGSQDSAKSPARQNTLETTSSESKSTKKNILAGRKHVEPTIGENGRVLNFSLGDIPPNSKLVFSYVIQVGSGVKYGKSVNVAVAKTITNATSQHAQALVDIFDDFSGDKTILLGRVFVDEDEMINKDSKDSEQEEGEQMSAESSSEIRGIANVRVYLEDGTYVVTDEEGMYHFEGVDPGVHVVQVDEITLPEGYELIESGWNNRFGGRGFSQFVDVHAGSVWRADFKVQLKPVPKGNVVLKASSERKDEGVTQTFLINMKGTVVPVENLRVMAMLPEGVEYLAENTCTIEGESYLPEVNGTVLTWRMGDHRGDWDKTICFKANVEQAKEDEALKIIAMFNTPTKKNQRTPVTELLVSTPNAFSGSQVIETVGELQVETEDIIEVGKLQEPSIYFKEEWLAKAAPGNEWLYPGDDYLPPIGSIHVGVKHTSKTEVVLFLDGVEVSPLNFDRLDKNQAKTVFASHWRGVHLHEGDNYFVASIRDHNSKEIERIEHVVHYSSTPVKSEFIPEKSRLIADGKTIPYIAVRLTDKDGYPARNGLIGEYGVEAPFEAYKKLGTFEDQRLAQVNQDRYVYEVGLDGIAYLKINPTPIAGEVTAKMFLSDHEEEVKAWLEPALREWILVGLAEGTYGYNVINSNREAIEQNDLEEDFFDNGRLAFFAKGKILGKWLLTLAYDSEKEKEENRLFEQIDPDSFYTLYGDATSQQYEAASGEKIFVKLEKNNFYALFGDMDTGLTVTELSKYSRSLTGVKSEFRGKHLEFNGFLSDTNLSFAKDEIRGEGTSGLYRLSRENLVMNSEKIVIETRDRFRNEIILESKQMSRHVDYDIDYFEGTLYFKRPVFSRDADLNPIFIVVDYEANDNRDKSYNYGGRGGIKFWKNKMQLGASVIHEEQVGGKADLYGADFTFNLTNNLELKAETAFSDKDMPNDKRSAHANILELSNNSDKVYGRIYYREHEKGFGLGQQSLGQTGTKKFGADGAIKATEKLSLNATIYRDRNLEEGNDRDVYEATIDYAGEKYHLKAGFNRAVDNLASGTKNVSNQLSTGGSMRIFDSRLNLRIDHYQSLGVHNDSVDFPTSTILGADYRLSNTVSFFAEHEITDGDHADSNNSRLGFESQPWNGGSLSSTFEQNLNENGQRLYAILGLAQTWHLNERWSIDAGIDHARTVKTPKSSPFNSNVPSASLSGEDFIAYTTGATYQREKWSWVSRLEHRASDSDEKWGALSSIVGEVHDHLTMSLRTQFHFVDPNGTGNSYDFDTSLGLAYRPLTLDGWIVLNRLDYFQENNKSSTNTFESSRIVNTSNANYSRGKFQLSLQIGLKYVVDSFDGDQYDGFTNLLGVESRIDITERIDFGFRFKLLQTWQAQTVNYFVGPSVGYKIAKNIWASVGYNFGGFNDTDFSRADFTSHGIFVQFRMKFDQENLKEVLEFFQRN